MIHVLYHGACDDGFGAAWCAWKHFGDVLFVAAYKDMADRRLWSLRSRGDFDVGEVAKARGGGGHKNAAGFRSAAIKSVMA